MDKHTYKKLQVYLKNFIENYWYFALSYTGKNLNLFLDQFIFDQVKMAQMVYGNQGAQMVKVVAQKLSGDGRLR